MKSRFEEMGGTYTLVGDTYIPDLKVSEHEETRPTGRWGHEHLRYIKEYRPLLYTDLAVSGDLGHYLADIDEQARKRLDRIMAQMRTAEGVTEERRIGISVNRDQWAVLKHGLLLSIWFEKNIYGVKIWAAVCHIYILKKI